MIFSGLVRFAPDGRVVPAVARDWRVEDDGLRYVFEIDANARFSDGQAVTAHDVVRSFTRVLSPDSRSSRQWVLDRIAGARAFSRGEVDFVSGLSAENDHTVSIELTEPFRPFLQMLAMPAAAVVREGADGLAGAGPWLLAEWSRGDFIRLEPNPHSARAPSLESVRFRVIPEAFTQIAEFESGALDILEVPQAEVDRFLSDKRLEGHIQSQPELRVVYIGLNNRRGPLQDVRVRRAINMAVDVEQVVDVLTSGHGVRSAGSVPPSLAGYEERAPYPYDPEAAKRLLAEAGYADGFPLEIWMRESPEGNRVVEAVQGYLGQVGIEVSLVKREWSAFKEAVSQGKVDAFFLDWWADYPDAENFLYPLFHSSNAGGGGNRAFFSDPAVDELIERAQRATDPAEGERLCARADSTIFEAAPWLYLYFPTSFVAVSPNVDGYVFPVLYLGQDFSTVRKLVSGS